MANTEKVVYFGSFRPEIAKSLPKDLDFQNGYFFKERNQVVANLCRGEDHIYEDDRTISCVKTILSGKQWDDPRAEKYVERYTGTWRDVKDIELQSKTIDQIVSAIKQRDSANKTLQDVLGKLTVQIIFGGKN
jgi:hypothetical protein